MRRSLVGVVLVLLSSGCPSAELALVVDLRTDLVPGVEFVAVRTGLYEEHPSSGASALQTVNTPALVGQDFLRGVRIGELDVTPGRVFVRAELLAADATVIAERTASVETSTTRAVTLVISRRCREVTCSVDEVCLAGTCTPCPTEPCVDDCTADADCPTPTSDCAEPRCMERSCYVVSLPRACADGQYCDPDLGCSELPEPLDAGPVGVDTGPAFDAGPCPPSCAGRACGPDGCGGSCGSCTPPTTCNDATGQCVCTPDCSGRECGPDPTCGQECGPCAAGASCTGTTCCDLEDEPCTAGSCCGSSLSCTGGTCCVALGGSCAGDVSRCCNSSIRSCTGGVCCIPIAGFCNDVSQCCNASQRSCVRNACCITLGEFCNDVSQCCDSAGTGFRRCRIPNGESSQQCCVATGGGCSLDSQCCSRRCAGTCMAP
jgi:hypothetical protein